MRQRRANKILMSIVLILLCLVLITTSVVSGIFAKYTVSKQILMMFGFESFGVSFDIGVSPELIDSTTVKVDGLGTATVTVTNIWLKPGDSIEDALIFTVGGKPTRDAMVKIDTVVELNTVFNVPQTEFPSYLGADTTFMPIGVYFSKNGDIKNYAHNPYSSYEPTIATAKISEAIEKNIPQLTYDATAKAAIKSLPKGTNIVWEDIKFSFDWPKEYGAGDELLKNDRIGTWISYKEPTFTITYYITVEEVVSPGQT